jgi:predicted nucleic acid-binding protein
MEIAAPEVLLCDTSFIGHYGLAGRQPSRYEHWPASTLDRITAAHLGLTPITLGELRAGYVIDKWGAARIAESENRIASYVVVPLDEATLDEYAKLHAHCKTAGVGIGHNDLWIAAVAISRGIPLVTCDRVQSELPGLDAIYLPPPQ